MRPTQVTSVIATAASRHTTAEVRTLRAGVISRDSWRVRCCRTSLSTSSGRARADCANLAITRLLSAKASTVPTRAHPNRAITINRPATSSSRLPVDVRHCTGALQSAGRVSLDGSPGQNTCPGRGSPVLHPRTHSHAFPHLPGRAYTTS